MDLAAKALGWAERLLREGAVSSGLSFETWPLSGENVLWADEACDQHCVLERWYAEYDAWPAAGAEAGAPSPPAAAFAGEIGHFSALVWAR